MLERAGHSAFGFSRIVVIESHHLESGWPHPARAPFDAELQLGRFQGGGGTV